MRTFLDLLDPPPPPEACVDTFAATDLDAPAFRELEDFLDRVVRARRHTQSHGTRKKPAEELDDRALSRALERGRRDSRRLTLLYRRARASAPFLDAEKLPKSAVRAWYAASAAWPASAVADLNHALFYPANRWSSGGSLAIAEIFHFVDGFLAFAPIGSYALSLFVEGRPGLGEIDPRPRAVTDVPDGIFLREAGDMKDRWRSSLYVVRDDRPAVVTVLELTRSQREWMKLFITGPGKLKIPGEPREPGEPGEPEEPADSTNPDAPPSWTDRTFPAEWPGLRSFDGVVGSDFRIYLNAISRERLSREFLFADVDIPIEKRCLEAPSDERIDAEWARLWKELVVEGEALPDMPPPTRGQLESALDRAWEGKRVTADGSSVRLGPVIERGSARARRRLGKRRKVPEHEE